MLYILEIVGINEKLNIFLRCLIILVIENERTGTNTTNQTNSAKFGVCQFMNRA